MIESMDGLKRTHLCGELRCEQVGQQVTLMGWVAGRRDHGGLIFIDLRDRTGIVQLVINTEYDRNIHCKAEQIRNEYVLAVCGRVVERPEGTKNRNIATGEIEVEVKDLRILNTSLTLPFEISDSIVSAEDIRLRYRYLDLRRPCMQYNQILRHRVVKGIRDFMDQQGFLEIETPFLTKSTPEGARDYLVPSRVNPGKFFALPQSPQLFKQLLMVSGFDKYFQIARCFRDEDLRADRQPEFTQIDVEMSFVEREDVVELTERLCQYLFEKVLGIDLKIPFPRLTYLEAKKRFGLDKPDIRFAMELVDLSEVFRDTRFEIFRKCIKEGGEVKGIKVEGGTSKIPQRMREELKMYVSLFGAKGLLWVEHCGNQFRSLAGKHIGQKLLEALARKMDMSEGDLGFLVADSDTVVAESLGNLRVELSRRLNLIVPNTPYTFTWVTDFPLFEYSENEDRLVSCHHPFTAPHDADLDKLFAEPEKVRSKAYDLVLDGHEIGGGSIRIHNRELQDAVFRILKIEEEEVKEKFGFLLEALAYGAPPHGGIAFGLDRLMMILSQADSIREVIAFPKTQKATSLMTGSPSFVDKSQLDELHIKQNGFDE